MEPTVTVVAVNPAYLPNASGRYSQAMIVDGSNTKWILLSGITAMDADYTIAAPDDAGGQAEFIFDKIKRLLADCGATMKNIVRINFYITDMNRFKEIAKVRENISRNWRQSQPVPC